MIIFLDIDGVLNNWDDIKDFPEMISPSKANKVDFLAQQLKAQIVVSSSWRLAPQTLETLIKYGISRLRFHPQWRTGPDKETRGAEIQTWLDQHPCDKYIILDDDADFTDEQKKHWYQTNMDTGLTDEIVVQIIKDHLEEEG